MIRITVLVLTILLLVKCSIDKHKPNDLNIVLYESYDIIDLYPRFLELNSVIRKIQIDSISKKSTGVALLDKLNKENAKTDTISGRSIDDFPLFQVFSLNTKLDKDGFGYLDSSSVLGTVFDSVKLLLYLKQNATLFQNDLEWKITGELHNSAKSLHAIRRNSKSYKIIDTDIDSVIIWTTVFSGYGKAIEKIADLNNLESTYWIMLKLNKNLSTQLKNRSYSLIINTKMHEYSGSIVNFIANPNQYITIGEMNKNDFLILKDKFEKVMVLK